MRLGFAVKVLGQPGLKASDTRRWQNNPHLSVSLAYLRDILRYLDQIEVRMYRLSSDLAPYATHPDLPQFHAQIDECATELAAVGEMARQSGIRLSFHPGPYTVLNSPDENIADKAILDLRAQADILDRMGMGPEAVINIHVGGLYGDKPAALDRFAQRFLSLPKAARTRLVLENDDRVFSIADTYAIHLRTGIRLVLDQLHHLCNPSPGVSLGQALALALGTWPADQTPKIHFSSPRTAMVAASRPRSTTEDGEPTGPRQAVYRQPRLSQHADLIDPFAFTDLLRLRGHLGRDFDVMLECKAKDLALLRLRRHLSRLAPEYVERYGIV
jgi:UV DNA damage endonuclease